MSVLTSIDTQQVSIVKIYPRVLYGPFGVPVEFKAPAPIINDFFQAITDHRPYPISRDTVASWDQNWFMEISVKHSTEILQIACYIPSDKGHIVVGMLGEFSEKSHSYDIDFQSSQLFQWYETYKDRWLLSETDQPFRIIGEEQNSREK